MEPAQEQEQANVETQQGDTAAAMEPSTPILSQEMQSSQVSQNTEVSTPKHLQHVAALH